MGTLRGLLGRRRSVGVMRWSGRRLSVVIVNETGRRKNVDVTRWAVGGGDLGVGCV
jgi:hypothetical protein